MRSDRISSGALAGIIGAVVQDIYGHTAKTFGITDRIFLDFAKIVLFHKPYGGIFGFIAGILSHLTFGMITGVLFVYLIKRTSSRYLYYKGMGMGMTIWFFSLGVATLYNLPLFKDIPPVPALITFVGALIWGLATAFSLKLIEKKTNLV
ncbi:MAG: hypothetical protein CVU89_06340 [Firmicutes bacterium HGW-Firmicutes-14]|nr:MAG: hypothetical protein CVU89_06340 [Firmicutes bacterium HGW-Firmicutes-14]